MNKGRLEAFSDGVIAIIITIMVLEFRVPHGADWSTLRPLMPVFLTYILSFVYVGIYWNNHHHLLHATKQISGGVMWSNMHLLFWLSLVPFVTGWMGENDFARNPVALYGVVHLMAAVAYYDPGAGAPEAPRARLGAGQGHRQRRQGHDLPVPVRAGHLVQLCPYLCVAAVLRRRGGDLACPRPPDRTCPEGGPLIAGRAVSGKPA